jgi:hypothetical protein
VFNRIDPFRPLQAAIILGGAASTNVDLAKADPTMLLNKFSIVIEKTAG